MKIPKGVDLRIDTEKDPVEVHIVANLTTKAQAHELITVIRQCLVVLEGERRIRIRKPKLATVPAS